MAGQRAYAAMGVATPEHTTTERKTENAIRSPFAQVFHVAVAVGNIIIGGFNIGLGAASVAGGIGAGATSVVTCSPQAVPLQSSKALFMVEFCLLSHRLAAL